MANTKSAIKRIRRISKQTVVNKARKSKFRNALKKMNALIESKEKKEDLKWIMNQKKEDPVLEDTDTGFTRFQTEELMREIGYVQ